MMMQVSMKFHEIIGKRHIWPLTSISDLDLEDRNLQVLRDTPFSDDACVYEVLLHYPFRSCGPDKENAYLTFDLY